MADNATTVEEPEFNPEYWAGWLCLGCPGACYGICSGFAGAVIGGLEAGWTVNI